MKIDGNDLYMEKCITKIEELIDKWNDRVIEGLRLFDEMYGTDYCPQ